MKRKWSTSLITLMIEVLLNLREFDPVVVLGLSLGNLILDL